MTFTPWSVAKGKAQRLAVVTAASALTGAAGAASLLPVKAPAAAVANALWQAANYSAQWISYAKAAGFTAGFKVVMWQPLALTGILAASATATLIAGIGALTLAMKTENYGESEFATLGDIKRMGIKGKGGVVLGRLGGRLLIPEAERHVLVVAPTRRGKTRGYAIPAILNYRGSIIVTDPKGELEKLTAAARRKLGPVYVINWASPQSQDAWSPTALSVLPLDPTELERHAERIAAQFFDTSGGGTEKYFNETARRNFAALLLFEFYTALETGVDPHIGDLISRLSAFRAAAEDNGDPFGDLLMNMAATSDLNGWPKRIAEDLSVFAATSTKERSSHLGTLITGIQLMRSDAVRAATRTASFSWEELRKKPCTVYIRFPQQDAAAYGALTSLFFNTMFAWALDNEQKDREQPIHVIADEFGSLKKIDLMQDLMSKGTGQGVTISIIVQDLAQPREVYGENGWATIRTNCTYTLAYSQNNAKTQEELSQLVGKTTRVKNNLSGKLTDPFHNNVTHSLEGVPLILPEQWGGIPFGQHVLLVEGHLTKPVFCKSMFWDKNRRMRRMVAA